MASKGHECNGFYQFWDVKHLTQQESIVTQIKEWIPKFFKVLVNTG